MTTKGCGIYQTVRAKNDEMKGDIIKKKIMALLLCAAMCVSLLTACGSDSGSSGGEAGDT